MAQPKRILYRGVPMIEGWPEKIGLLRTFCTYTLNRKAVPRIRYGQEHDDWGAEQRACHDCQVLKGELHVPGLRWRRMHCIPRLPDFPGIGPLDDRLHLLRRHG